MANPALAGELADRLAVEDVLIRYAACIDDRDFDAYRELFAPDVALYGFGREAIHGVDAWMDFVRKVLVHYSATQHLLGPARVELHGDTAELRAELQAQHFLREPSGRIFTLWGTYRSALARVEGAWKLQRHELTTHSTRTDDAFRTDSRSRGGRRGSSV